MRELCVEPRKRGKRIGGQNTSDLAPAKRQRLDQHARFRSFRLRECRPRIPKRQLDGGQRAVGRNPTREHVAAARSADSSRLAPTLDPFHDGRQRLTRSGEFAGIAFHAAKNRAEFQRYQRAKAERLACTRTCPTDAGEGGGHVARAHLEAAERAVGKQCVGMESAVDGFASRNDLALQLRRFHDAAVGGGHRGQHLLALQRFGVLRPERLAPPRQDVANAFLRLGAPSDAVEREVAVVFGASVAGCFGPSERL